MMVKNRKIDIIELLNLIGPVALAFSFQISVSHNVIMGDGFGGSMKAAGISVDSPSLMYLGWSSIILAGAARSFNIDLDGYADKLLDKIFKRNNKQDLQ